ncbi:MAG TPA: hypothetical protein VLX09_04355 [Stellaceae bacterium]|nr:hypothetical protein [Stellaceae bacterium]
MAKYLFSAQHWRARAAEARSVAEQMKDARAKRIMLEIATSYDKLVEHAAKKERATDKE